MLGAGFKHVQNTLGLTVHSYEFHLQNEKQTDMQGNSN